MIEHAKWRVQCVNIFLCLPLSDAMANPSPAKSMGDPGITPLSPSHTQVTQFSSAHWFLCLLSFSTIVLRAVFVYNIWQYMYNLLTCLFSCQHGFLTIWTKMPFCESFDTISFVQILFDYYSTCLWRIILYFVYTAEAFLPYWCGLCTVSSSTHVS